MGKLRKISIKPVTLTPYEHISQTPKPTDNNNANTSSILSIPVLSGSKNCNYNDAIDHCKCNNLWALRNILPQKAFLQNPLHFNQVITETKFIFNLSMVRKFSECNMIWTYDLRNRHVLKQLYVTFLCLVSDETIRNGLTY